MGAPRLLSSLEQAIGLLKASEKFRLYAYVVVSLTTGIRTEEARALRWDHVILEGDLSADTPVPPHAAVWRSVRAHGDVKTEKSRCTLALPKLAVDALKIQKEQQAEDRMIAGPLWQEHGLVFASAVDCLAISSRDRQSAHQRSLSRRPRRAGAGRPPARRRVR